MDSEKYIAIAEDSQTQAAQTLMLLRKLGYFAKTFENGKLAYDAIMKNHPSLIISDIVMPVMNGYQLCEKIKQNASTKNIPVILLTTLNSPEDVKKGLLCGADDFIPKPINYNLLKSHITQLINHDDLGKSMGIVDEISSTKVLSFLMSTYETALTKNQELEKTKNELAQLNLILEKKVDERTKELKQRIKELNCLHDINDLYESIDFTSHELLKQTSLILRNSFTQPEKVEIYINLNGTIYKTDSFNENDTFLLSSPIKSLRTIIGTIKVSYNSNVMQNPFTKEEKRLVDSVAQRMFELYELGEKELKILNQNKELKKNIERIKRINMELECSRKRAVESDKLKSAFLANMSHEIRTPLNSIVGFTDIFDDPEIDNQTRENYAKIIKDSSMHLLAIVNDVLDISKIETGQMHICIQECNINNLLDSIRNVFAPQFASKGVVLKYFNDAPKDSTIKTDAQKLTQVFNNLISNALKFTSKGTVEFGIINYENKTTFFVKDTGIGIPNEFKAKIFERFTQVDSSTIRNYGGNGLGLSISKKLVELLGGEIWFESELNRGTTFFFNLTT